MATTASDHATSARPSTVGEGPLRLFVKDASTDTVTVLNVSDETTIGEAKRLLLPVLAPDVPEEDWERVRLIFSGPELESNDRSFSDYNIQQDATLHWILATQNEIVVGNGHFPLVAKVLLPGDNTKEIMLNLSTAVDANPAEAKSLLSAVLAVPVEHLRLIFGGKQIDDQRTFSDQNIARDCLIHAIIRPEE